MALSFPLKANQETNVDVLEQGMVKIDSLNLSVIPPEGWSVHENRAGMSLVIEKPLTDEEKKIVNVPVYKKNITVTARHTSTPVDKAAADALSQEITEALAKRSDISGAEVLPEQNFFDYKGVKDGLILYAKFTLNNVEMMQMHVLVSGEFNQFQFTYTDMAKSFDGEDFQNAWKTISTSTILGKAPVRYKNEAIIGGVALLALLLIVFAIRMRFRAAERAYKSASDMIYTDDGNFSPMTQSQVWNLDGAKSDNDDDTDDYSRSDIATLSGY